MKTQNYLRDKPLQLRFQEHLSDRRVDVRALAARSLAALDQFDPLVKELSDARQYSFWGAEVESLRAAINRSPDTAAKVRDSLERLRAKENQTLFRLLWGYSPQQLAVSTVKEKDGTPRDGAARELLTWLENPEMDVRVLAIDNLRLITGAQLGYRPEKSPDVPTNRLPISKWRDRLKTGKIAYKSPPTPLTERKPLDRPRE